MTFRTILISPRQRREIVAHVEANPGRTAVELREAADTARLRMLITDGLRDLRERSMVRMDEAGRYWAT